MINKTYFDPEAKMTSSQALSAGSALLNDCKNQIITLACAFQRTGNTVLYEELIEISEVIATGNAYMYNSWMDMMESNNSTLSGINGKLLASVASQEKAKP